MSCIYSYEVDAREYIAVDDRSTVLEADIMECRPLKDISSKGFMKYVWGGRQVIFKKRPVLEPFDKNPTDDVERNI